MANSNVESGQVAISIESCLNLYEEQRNRHNQKPSIFMVSHAYRNHNPSCFDPKIVSIGPLHRGHQNVQENEGLKGAYVNDLLDRVSSQSSPQQTLESCFSKVKSYINDIKLCYGEINNYTDFDFTKMMVTDACFILELIQKIFERGNVIFPGKGNTFMISGIFKDLFLIENQIPFFVLRDIFDLTLRRVRVQASHSLTFILLNVLTTLYIPLDIETRSDINNDNLKHILEIVHISCRPANVRLERVPETVKHISHSVVELDQAGVKFKPRKDENMAMVVDESFGWLWTFPFFKKPTLAIPVFTINDNTELLLRNLVAFEQSYLSEGNHYFTSFVFAMDMLVDTKEDVVKLVESKVIINDLGSNEDATNMINSLCNDLGYTTFLYLREFKELDEYCKSYWPKHMARLKRTYFNSPWKVIALIAGILLFALTAIQTIFTVKSA